MELYILSKKDLSIKSIIKPSDYEINLDEETNAKTTFILKKCDGLKEGNFIVVNGLYKQFLFVIPSGGITTEKGSNIVTVTALDISNIFDRKIIKKDTDLMTNNSIEEFLAKTISENFVNSDDPYLNIPYMLINWKTETKAVVDTNAENGLYNFHTFLINCRQYKNICTDFKFKEKIKESYRTAQGKKIEIQNGKKGTHLLITTKGETVQTTREGRNIFNKNAEILTSTNAPEKTSIETGIKLTSTKKMNYNGTIDITMTLGELQNFAGKTIRVKTNMTRSNDTLKSEVTLVSFKSSNSLSVLGRSTIDSGLSKEALITYNVGNTVEEGRTLGIVFYLTNGAPAAISDYVTFEDLMITVDDADMTYEPYGSTPSFDNPSPIENTTKIEIIDRGEQLLKNSSFKENLDEWAIGNTSTNKNTPEISEIFNQKCLHITGELKQSKAVYQLIQDRVEVGKTYAISCKAYLKDFVKGTTNSFCALYLEGKKTSGGWTGVTYNSSGYAFTSTKYDYSNGFVEITSTITIKQDTDLTKPFRVSVFARDFTGDLYVYDLKLQEGKVTTAYTPYQEQKGDFPLSEGQKLYKASYLASNGIHHKRKQVVFDGSDDEGWVFNGFIDNPTDNLYAYYIVIKDRKKNGNCLCDYFKKVSSVEEKGMFSGTSLNFIVEGISTLAEWKTWLSEHPITVEYELSEEEIIPYTEAQQEAWNKIEELMMFEGYNSIESNAQLDIKYNYIYPENAKLIIDIENKEDNIAIIDTTLAEVTDSNKIYEANYTAKVQVLIREDNSIYNLYLKTNRTTTENKDDPDRASGKVETISVDTADKAREEALNVMKGNTYKHLVEFKISKTSKLIDITKLYIGRKVKIKTEDDIYDSYISAITLNDENFVYFKSGNLRIDLLDKLKKQKESVGNKLDVEGGTIKNLKIEKDLDINGNYYKNGEKIDTEMQIKTGEEYATNEYIDGKRVYIKQLEFNDIVGGGQDNRLEKSHGIVGAEKIWVDLSNSYIKATTTKATYPLPVILYSGNISALSIIVDLTNIYMESQGGWGTIWTKVIRLKYTKV